MSKFAVMFFNTEIELGMSNVPGRWVNTGTFYTENGAEALSVYANTPCPASQLIQAGDDEELRDKVREMLMNYKDEDWLNRNLYPRL